MDSSHATRTTQKAILTRQRILDTALNLFATQGYEQTTMRDIAAAAGCSLGLAYRYFASKEDFVLELYCWLVDQLEEQVDQLPTAPLASRFHDLMRNLFALMAPHRLTLSALFGAALNPLSRAGLFGQEGSKIRQRARAMYVIVVREAKDAPRTSQVEDLATVLYGLQLALVLFWLQDLSNGVQKTDDLVALLCDLMQRMRPFLRLPWAAQLLVRVVNIVGPMLGQQETVTSE